MNAPEPDPSEEVLWFEALGGAPVPADKVADALALRCVLAVENAAVQDEARPAATSWQRLRERLLDEWAQEDREWFEAIGGNAAAASDAVRQGQRLRTKLAPPAGMEARGAGAATQTELLRRIAALAPAPRPVARSTGRWHSWLRALSRPGFGRTGIALATVFLLAIGVGIVLRQSSEEEVERGAASLPRIGPDGAPTIDVADPQSAASDLAKALAAAGVPAVSDAENGHWIVRAVLPNSLSPAAEQILRERRLQVPPDRLLEIVFVRAP